MSKPLVTIIIPVYNGEPYLQRCFLSLDKQIYENLEIIFIDNNSKDQSIKIIQEYCARKYNARLIFCKKQGPAAARNLGISESKGEYISFLDVDDEILPNKFFDLLDGFEKFPNAMMSIGRTKKLYQNGLSEVLEMGELNIGLNTSLIPGLFWLEQFQHNPHISSILLKNNINKRKFNFPEKLFFGEDIAFFIKIGLFSDVVLIDKNVSIYYRHNKSSISKANRSVTIYERYLQFFEIFAIPYFSERKYKKIYSLALHISQKISFKLIMKLFFLSNKKNYSYNMKNYKYPSYYQLYFFFFKILPFNYANFILEFFTNVIKYYKIKKITSSSNISIKNFLNIY